MKPNSKSKSLETANSNGDEILKRELGCSLVTAFRTFFTQAVLAPKKAPPASARNPLQDDVILHVDYSNLSCPPLETLPNKNNPVDCFCERKPKSLISRRGRKRVAFTLAEVLITLAIIGVVAVLTVPALIQNYNTKAWETAQDVFTKRLEVATRQMNTEEKLAGYSNTMDFVNELKKYIKITRVCDNSNITKCFNKEVIWNEGEDPVDMSKIKNAASLGQDDWDTDTVAVQFANGVNAIIAYNPNATQDPFNNQFSATSNSMAILYDVSGNKNPNTNGKDIAGINVTELAGTIGCMINPDLVGGMCISQILAPGTGFSPMTLEECNQAVSEGTLGINACYYDADYWTGAVKACGGVSKMPSQDQLTELAKYVYNNDSINSSGYTYDLALDTEKGSQFLSASSYSDKFNVWSGQEYIQLDAYERDFLSTSTAGGPSSRDNSEILAVCISD